jgi:3-hydroxy-9,10-secoandrosta-1,3,5(10)-triene-9,17-dione monooxygenase reductase component
MFKKFFNFLGKKFRLIDEKTIYLDNELFKHALGSFTTGVTIVTTKYLDVNYGITISSFASVSLNPHLVLFCLDKNAHRFTPFANSQYFSVSILSNSQENISRHFAHNLDNIWDGITTKNGKFTENPLIAGALYYIECHKDQMIEAGDHYIIVGKVLGISKGETELPLIHFRGEYEIPNK